MHNRARMIVASFLTKDLYVDWRAGARHFLDLLLDGDLANNNLNWQWVAGTGTDTNPHRVFNPTVQGNRFDPDGDYVRRYVPELARGQGRRGPRARRAKVRRAYDYPEPIVDHHEAIAALPRPASVGDMRRTTWTAVSPRRWCATNCCELAEVAALEHAVAVLRRTRRRSSRRCPSSRAARG